MKFDLNNFLSAVSFALDFVEIDFFWALHLITPGVSPIYHKDFPNVLK